MKSKDWFWIFHEKPKSSDPDDVYYWVTGPYVYLILCLSIITVILWGV